jgi:SAM-dependent methyltransferase
MRASIQRNRQQWNADAGNWVAPGLRSWSTDEITWGEYAVPEDEVGALTGIDLAGAAVVELGCGTGYVSAWLARRGARPVGLDPTEGQLASARRFQEQFDLPFPLVQAAGEEAPFRDGLFDLAISEYGAALWADPRRWIPEAARLLKPGGELVFLTNSVLFSMCAPDAEEPAGERLLRPQRGLETIEFSDTVAVEYHTPHGEMIRLLRSSGFEVLDLLELHAAAGSEDRRYITTAWARRWPHEEIWRARKT